MCTTPCHEKCAQLGDVNYETDARLEAHAFTDQLQRTHGELPSGAYFTVVDCPHDFGVYLDVKFTFDDTVDAHTAYLECLQESLEYWDPQATEQLTRAGYTLVTSALPKTGRVA